MLTAIKCWDWTLHTVPSALRARAFVHYAASEKEQERRGQRGGPREVWARLLESRRLSSGRWPSPLAVSRHSSLCYCWCELFQFQSAHTTEILQKQTSPGTGGWRVSAVWFSTPVQEGGLNDQMPPAPPSSPLLPMGLTWPPPGWCQKEVLRKGPMSWPRWL